MVINTNFGAMTALTKLSETTHLLNKSLARLSTGSKLVDPEDDAAGAAIAVRLDGQIAAADAVLTSAATAISYNQVQTGFLGKVGKALDRMAELATLAQNGLVSDSDRTLYDNEYVAIRAYLDDISAREFNGVSLFNGGTVSTVVDELGNTYSYAGPDITNTQGSTPEYQDLITGVGIDTTANAATALGLVQAAIQQFSTDRGMTGAAAVRYRFAVDQMQIVTQNLQAAASRIRDVDVASESTQFARYSILMQAGTAILAQANVLPQTALRLLT